MKKNKLLIVTALMLVAVFAFAGCTGTQTQESTQTEQTESSQEEDTSMDAEETTDEFTGDAYNFDLTDLDGNVYKLSDLGGKKVYVKFWASWCSICLAGMEEFEELNEAYKDNDDVLILTMVAPGTSGEMDTKEFKEWFESQGYDFNVMLDVGGLVMRKYGIRGFPTSVFIDSSGNIAKTVIGHADNDTIESVFSDMS